MKFWKPFLTVAISSVSCPVLATSGFSCWDQTFAYNSGSFKTSPSGIEIELKGTGPLVEFTPFYLPAAFPSDVRLLDWTAGLSALYINMSRQHCSMDFSIPRINCHVRSSHPNEPVGHNIFGSFSVGDIDANLDAIVEGIVQEIEVSIVGGGNIGEHKIEVKVKPIGSDSEQRVWTVRSFQRDMGFHCNFFDDDHESLFPERLRDYLNGGL